MTNPQDLGGIDEVLYLSDRYPTKEALEACLRETVAPDATRLQWIAGCPRRAQYALVEQITEAGDAIVLRAGSALHAAMATYYASGSMDLALDALRRKWGSDESQRSPGAKFAHLNLGFLEVICKNYFTFARRHDTFKPIVLPYKQLNLENVLGAIWRMTSDGRVILGESKIIMEFEVNGEKFVYSGIPDLPIEMGGAYYVLDFKSTNSYLSSWWAEQYKFSNQFRGYIAMLSNLTRLNFSGTLVRGIYMGEKAVQTETKTVKFDTFGPFMYQPSHIEEAILNQYAWRKSLDFWKELGYYPQHASKLCSGCPFFQLCDTNPAVRQSVIDRQFKTYDVNFLSI